MKLAISRMHYPVTALGPGRRAGIWVQGCAIGCPGCASRDTWERPEESFVELKWLLDWCAALPGDVQGVTISGGEPFEQPEALAGLLEALHAWRRERAPEIDLLCYSGLSWRRLCRDHGPILALLDAIIPEPFVERLPPQLWRGSANQRIVALSPLGKARYDDTRLAASPPHMQVAVDGGEIWFIGIPGRGDLDKVLDAAAARGVSAGGASWRS